MISWKSALFLVAISGIAAADFHYREATPGYVYHFPADFFDHPSFRMEWWYYTGNLSDSRNRRFGFELVFFRQGERRGPSDNKSAWRVDDMYLAHAAFTDIDGKHFSYSERTNRAGPGVAGVSALQAKVWNGNWQARWLGQNQKLTALTDDFQFALDVKPLKPLVIHGINGVSQKAAGEGQASHYISFPRMAVSGNLRWGGEEHSVKGLAWMDHEWFSDQLSATQQGWDWFSVQLEDKTELMLFDLREKNGSIDAYSAGTFVNASGQARHLASSDFILRPLEYWHKYPVKWQIEIPSLKLRLECRVTLQEQELKTGASSYWEGAVTYSGTQKGVGYLEMTGYGQPVTFQ